MKDLVFRRAEEKDMDKILDLEKRIFNKEQEIPEKEIMRFLDMKPQCWCAVDNGAVVGAVAAWIEDEKMHWGRFVTDNNYRGHHIGTKLARLSFDDLFSHGVDNIWMEAREITTKIVCKMGGEIVGKSQQFFLGTVTPVILKRESYIKS